jgi:hypothetical protein
MTRAHAQKSSSVDGTVQTARLRKGERCRSDFHYVQNADERTNQYIFMVGKWTLNYQGNVKCNAGGYSN